jgi:hypothetical protein
MNCNKVFIEFNSSSNPEYSNFASELIEMATEDQSMRKLAIIDQSKWNDLLNRKHSKRLEEIIEQIGWPTIGHVGKRASNCAWLLIQHADENIQFQKYCLKLMQAKPDGQVYQLNIAFLEDRIRTSEKQPQLYGTQLTIDRENDKLLLKEFEGSIHELNIRRLKIGMEPLSIDKKMNLIVPCKKLDKVTPKQVRYLGYLQHQLNEKPDYKEIGKLTQKQATLRIKDLEKEVNKKA